MADTVLFNPDALLAGCGITMQKDVSKELDIHIDLEHYRQQGKDEILARVRQLPSPIVVTFDGHGRCDWCEANWHAPQAFAIHMIAESHPANSCLWSLAHPSATRPEET